jgi:hypothetical protein
VMCNGHCPYAASRVHLGRQAYGSSHVLTEREAIAPEWHGTARRYRLPIAGGKAKVQARGPAGFSRAAPGTCPSSG